MDKYYIGFYGRNDTEISISLFYGDVTVYATFDWPTNWNSNDSLNLGGN